jgi:chromosome segregation ATPase
MDDADQSEETETGRDDSLAQLKKLNQMKAALDEEFAELMEEKQVLLQYKDSKKNMSIKEAKAYQKKVTLLNQRITDFEERRQAYKKEADAFNAQAGK